MTRPNRDLWRLSFIERRTLLIVGDLFVSIISLAVALLTWATISDEWLGLSLAFFQERVAIWFYLLPLAWIILLIDLYDVRRAARWQYTIKGVTSSAAFGLVIYLIIYFASDNPLPRIYVAIFFILSYLLTLIWRIINIRIFTTKRFLRRVLVVGGGKAGSTILEVSNQISPKPFNVIGIVDDDPDMQGIVVEGHKVISASDRLLQIIEDENISEIIVAISGVIKGSTFQALLDAQQKGVDIIRMPVLYEQLLERVPISILEADWILRSFIDQFRLNRFYNFTKRLFDIAGGIVGCLLLVVILPFVGLAIIIDSGRPIFYSQTRLGKGGKTFDIIKFRTMRIDAEKDGEEVLATEHDDRATRVGLLLRRTHIDEIPQFINVLIGDLSLVGPRSERPSLVEHYLRRIPFYRARLLVKPGVTGWAQVNFGYAGNVEETKIKLEYDLYYIKNRNILIDILAIIRTPGTMLGMRGQ